MIIFNIKFTLQMLIKLFIHWLDMEYASQFFSKAGEAEFRVSFIIRLVEGINVGLVVEKLLALPLDAICVHCVSIRCIHLFYQVKSVMQFNSKF